MSRDYVRVAGAFFLRWGVGVGAVSMLLGWLAYLGGVISIGLYVAMLVAAVYWTAGLLAGTSAWLVLTVTIYALRRRMSRSMIPLGPVTPRPIEGKGARRMDSPLMLTQHQRPRCAPLSQTASYPADCAPGVEAAGPGAAPSRIAPGPASN